MLASFAMSWLGIGAGALAALAAAGLAIYLRAPPSWLLTIGILYGAWLYSGLVYQDGVAACEARVEKAIDAAEARWQAAVRKADDAARQRASERDRAQTERRSAEDAYEALLVEQKDSCIVTDQDARDLQ